MVILAEEGENETHQYYKGRQDYLPFVWQIPPEYTLMLGLAHHRVGNQGSVLYFLHKTIEGLCEYLRATVSDSAASAIRSLSRINRTAIPI